MTSDQHCASTATAERRTTSWDDVPVEEREAHIGHFVAMSPSLTSSVRFIRAHMRGYRTSPEGEIAFLLGDTRAGKTTAINEVIDQIAEETGGQIVSQILDDNRESEALVSVIVQTPNGIERPIVKIFVPVGPTFNGLLSDVLVAFDIRLPQRAKFAERLLALGRQLSSQRTRLVIFDDTQHICEKGKREPAYEASEVFKVLAKTGRMQVLCVGLEHTREIKDANRQAEWLGGEEHWVKPLEIVAATEAPLAKFCTTLNSELPFDQPSKLNRPEMFVPLGMFCEGYEGRIATLVRLMTQYAIYNHHPRLDQTVGARYLQSKSVPDAENPFLLSGSALDDYPKRVAANKKDRIVAAEKRRSKGRKTRTAFGARGR